MPCMRPLMGSRCVVVLYEFPSDCKERPLIENQQMVETFAS